MLLAVVLAGASLVQVVDYVGPSAVLKVYAGAVPASCEVAPGALLARLALPAVWLTPGGRQVGAWRAAGVDGTGIASCFRVYDVAESRCGFQGLVGLELELDSSHFVAGSDFAVSRFALTVVGDGSITCRARGQSLYRRLIREMVRESGDRGLVRYRTLIRDLKTSKSIPAGDNEYLLAQDSNVLVTQGGVPFQLEGMT